MKSGKIILRILSAVFAVLGLATAVSGIAIALSAIDAEPVLVEKPGSAREQVSGMLDYVCSGDYESAGAMLLGSPSLGGGRDASDEAGALLWKAFTQSLSYELIGECYATDFGVAQDVQITALVFDSVTATLRERTQALLQQRLEEAEDVSQIYDEKNNFREDVVMDALMEALEAAIDEDAVYETLQIRVNLVCVHGQWWIVPDSALLEAISGGILN